MRFRTARFRIGMIATISAVISVALPATAAHASSSIYLSAQAGAGGSGIAKGTLTWDSARRGVLTARVTDRCPGDGLGVYVFGKATFANGTTLTEINWYDGDGCQSSGEETLYGHGISNPQNRVIKSVVFKLCISNGWPSSWNDCVASSTSGTYVNPLA